MEYLETKTNIEDFNWKYICEDVFGKATIYSKEKLKPEILDEIVLDNILAKHIKKGHTKDIYFEAEFKNLWEEIDEDEKYLDINEHNKKQTEMIKENKEIKNWRKKNIWKFYLLAISFTLLFIYFIMDNIKSLIN